MQDTTPKLSRVGGNNFYRLGLELFDRCIYLKGSHIEEVLFPLCSRLSKGLLIQRWRVA